MKILKPVVLTDSNIESSNAVEEYSDWSAGTYVEGDTVVHDNSIWESLAGGSTDEPSESSSEWLRIGPSNRWAMFDNSVSTQTTKATGNLVVEVKANQITNSLALLNMVGNTVTIEMIDDVDGLVYTKVVELDSTIILDWQMYFFESFNQLQDLVITDLPLYGSATIRITLEADNVAIGGLIVGPIYEIGKTQYNVNFGIRDYSIKETDDFGRTFFRERNFSKRMSPTIFIRNSNLVFVSRLLTDIRATPTVFIGSEDPTYEPLIVFGYLRDWDIEIPYPEDSLLRLEVEGLT